MLLIHKQILKIEVKMAAINNPLLDIDDPQAKTLKKYVTETIEEYARYISILDVFEKIQQINSAKTLDEIGLIHEEIYWQVLDNRKNLKQKEDQRKFQQAVLDASNENTYNALHGNAESYESPYVSDSDYKYLQEIKNNEIDRCNRLGIPYIDM